MKVLIVDDYSTMRRIIRNQLTQLGYHDVDEAADGDAALKKLHATRYDLVISDLIMEPVTGFDLLKQVRADAKLKALPFVMITAEAKAQNLAAARQAGVDGYLVKPFDVATLRRKIEAALNAKASQNLIPA
jgi:two-component system chemotaxis response regulator CheY